MSTSSASTATASTNAMRRWFDSGPVRVVALLATITFPAAFEGLRLSALADNDIWWHLRTGLWILQDHAIPRSGLFSQSSSLPWIDASWGFDLLTGMAYRRFGLAALPLSLMFLQLAIATGLFMLARVTSRKFWPAVILTAIGQCCIVPLQPRPALCSIFFLAVELAILLTSRRTGDTQRLFWLPAIFLLWANLDRQFAYGLFALALFCLAAVIERLGRNSGLQWLNTGLLPLNGVKLTLAAGGSLLATFFTPYTWHLHALIWQSATSSAADRYFRPLHAMRFRQPQDYLLMLLVMTAFFVLGRRRSRDVFLISLLIVAAVISFRLQRDNWLVVVVSVAIIGNALFSLEENRVLDVSRPYRRDTIVAAALAIIVAAALGLRIGATRSLHPKIAAAYPVAAAEYIRQSNLPQPLFNAYEFGGFLTWYLPEYPVYIDGRIDLYGDGINIPYFKLMQAEIPLQSHAGFTSAQTFFLQADSPLGEALVTLPGFRLIYRDKLAVVIVREK
jgi:hypothetical protein